MVEERRPATMEDVARRAGVSVSTVSRALRGLPTVSPDARRRVELAARELSFAVSRSASSLVTGKTGRVAVLAPSLEAASWFHATALTSIARALREADLDLLLYVISDVEERRAFFERLPARRNADALITVSFTLTQDEHERLDDLGMPVVLASQHAPGRASVYVDDIAGAREGVRHLLELGHRRIAHLRSAGPASFVWSANDRLEGYRQALAEAGLPYEEELVVRPESSSRAIREAVGSLLSLPQQPTAIFAESDWMAFEVLGVLRSCGVEVPARMSVLGFDDQPLAEALGLSSISQSASDQGRIAAELVAGILTDPETDPARHIVLPTRLVLRSTTAPPLFGHQAQEN